jgi:uncharacterized membrane protein
MATAVETRRDVEAASEAVSRPRLPGFFLGIGLGGFVDGIVLHQILQWHHMLTSEGEYPKTTVAGLETNNYGTAFSMGPLGSQSLSACGFSGGAPRTGDGLSAAVPFSGGCWSAGACSPSFEGIVDHQILTIHHVREGADNTWLYDGSFLAFGGLLLVGGWLLTRSAEARLIKPS